MDTQNRDTEIFTDHSFEQTRSHSASKSFIANVFLWMFAALLISSVCAYTFATIPGLRDYLYIQTTKGLSLSTLGMAVTFAPLAFVMLMSFGLNKLSFPALAFSFMVFAAVMGMSLSSIFLRYEMNSIYGCFLSASAMFGIMAVMGYTTKQDLTGFGSILRMALIGIVVAMIINFFLGSSQIDYIISLLGVAIFTGLTAYDVQKLKRIGAGLEYEDVPSADVKKLSIMGALNLYLDFINIFLFLLRLFGRRRNSSNFFNEKGRP